MRHPGAVPAKPPTVYFTIRLVDSTGAAFVGKDYQLWWGGKLASEGVTGADGSVAADLDDRFDYGYLDLGEREEGSFVARLTIPIEVVPPPPPPPKPAKPPRTAPGRAPGAPRGPGGWTDEPDPAPPPPIPPVNTEDEEAWRRYEQQRREWEAWEQRRRQRREEAERQRRMDEEMRRRQEEEDVLRRESSGGRNTPVLPRETPAPPMSPEQRDELEKRLQRRREELHAGKVRLYELAWRLRNLGYLPDSQPLVFPVEDTARIRLLQALRRFAYRRGLPLPELADMDGELSADLKKLGDEIKREHDG